MRLESNPVLSEKVARVWKSGLTRPIGQVSGWDTREIRDRSHRERIGTRSSVLGRLVRDYSVIVVPYSRGLDNDHDIKLGALMKFYKAVEIAPRSTHFQLDTFCGDFIRKRPGAS